MSDWRRKKIEDMQNNPNMPIDDMPDCLEKLEKIRADCLKNNKKYIDQEFDHEDQAKVLGSNIFDNGPRRG